ncbi:hypothetical protein K490DRAFT_62148 [Saccharata proteae CBS 121410]|uniref:Uncharacterized protein n=1 Tax=Saccharata proteae CBS 121410 TaxID=1314787 RepID=A0A9P4LXQ3_9PEZI|nr:hypothetical protein K490DRAFT_62148 [Saccharata proteae CBS 121410]
MPSTPSPPRPPDPGTPPPRSPPEESPSPTKSEIRRRIYKAAITLTAYAVIRQDEVGYQARRAQAIAQQHRAAMAPKVNMGQPDSTEQLPGSGQPQQAGLSFRQRPNAEQVGSNNNNAGLGLTRNTGQTANAEQTAHAARQFRFNQRANTAQMGVDDNNNNPGLGYRRNLSESASFNRNDDNTSGMGPRRNLMENASFNIETNPGLGSRRNLNESASFDDNDASNDNPQGMAQRRNLRERPSFNNDASKDKNRVSKSKATAKEGTRAPRKKATNKGKQKSDAPQTKESSSKAKESFSNFGPQASSSSAFGFGPQASSSSAFSFAPQAKESTSNLAPQASSSSNSSFAFAPQPQADDYSFNLPPPSKYMTPLDRALYDGTYFAPVHARVPSQPISYVRGEPVIPAAPAPRESYVRSEPLPARSSAPAAREPVPASSNAPAAGNAPAYNAPVYTASTSETVSTNVANMGQLHLPRLGPPPAPPGVPSIHDSYKEDAADKFICGDADCDWTGTYPVNRPDTRIRCAKCGFPIVYKCRTQRQVRNDVHTNHLFTEDERDKRRNAFFLN